MDRQTARQVLGACQTVSEILTKVLQERVTVMADEDRKALQEGVYQTLAYMSDYLIQPAVDLYPDLNPYAKVP